jgi:hypothetical protein
LDRNPVSQPDYTSEESEYDAWQSKKSSLEDTVQAAKQSLEDVTRTRESTLRQKKRDIASAEVLSNADSTNQVYELEISEIQRKIAALQEIKNENGNITAKNEGYVSNVQILTGGRTADSAAILLIDETSNWQFSFSISSEQAKFIHLNDTLKLTLNGQPEMEVTADYLDSNSQGGYNILCQIPKGNGYPGTSGNIKKVVQGQLQTLTVPIDALHVEQNATYVYTLNERAGILGNEYYVEKLKVQVADKNDIYAAIESGVISKDTEIIIYSGKELEQGEVVRVNN